MSITRFFSKNKTRDENRIAVEILSSSIGLIDIYYQNMYTIVSIQKYRSTFYCP